MPNIIKADIPFRTKLFTFYGVMVLFVAVFIKYILPVILYNFRHLEVHTSHIVAEAVVIIVFLLFSWPSAWLILIGKRIVRHNQDPYPGMKVIFDTEVISGKKATRRGKIYMGLGYFCIIASIAGSIQMHRIFMLIRSTPMVRDMPLFR